MKKILLFVTIIASLLLGACTQVVYDGPRDDVDSPRPTADFSVVITEARYDELGEDADFSSEKSVTSAEIGEELVFITAHRSGPQFVHIRIFDPNGKTVDEIGPVEDWDGIAAAQYVLHYTPTQTGRFNFEASLSGANGAPFADSPYRTFVEVVKEGGGEPPPSTERCTSVADATLTAPASVTRDQNFEIRFYIPCDVEYASLQVYNDRGDEVDRWTVSSSSQLDDIAGTTIRRNLSYSQNDELYVELTVNRQSHPNRTLKAYVQVGSGPSGGTTTPPPPTTSCTSTTRASLDTPSSVARNERFDARSYIPCGTTYASLQVYNDRGNEVGKWILSSSDLDRYVGKFIDYGIRHDRNDRLHLQLTVQGRYSNQIDRYVRIGSGPSGGGGGTNPPTCNSTSRATLTTPSSVTRNERFDARFYVPCGSDYVSLQVYNDAGNEVDRWTLSGSEIARYEGGSVDYELRYNQNDRLRLELTVEGRYPTSPYLVRYVNIGSGVGGGTTPPPTAGTCPATNFNVAVRYGDFDYTGTAYIPRSGEIFRLTWESRSSDFESRYIQLYDVNRGLDVYSSAERSGNHGIRPSDLAVGEYQLRFSGYYGDGRTACVREVTIHISN